MRIRLRALVLAMLGLILPLLSPRALAAGPFAIELDGLANFSTISPYVNAAHSFGSWHPYDASPQPVLDANNYPDLASKAESISFMRAYPGWREGSAGNRPVINYTVIWEGGNANGANLTFINRPLVNLITEQLPDSTFRHIATLPFAYDSDTGEASLTMRVDNTLPGSNAAVSNIRIIPQQYITGLANPTDAWTVQHPTFREEFLRKASPFSILRMMDWQQTNSGTLSQLDPVPQPFTDPRRVEWADRTPTSIFSRTTNHGVPYEEIIELGNVTKKDLWLNIPDRATVGYMQGLSTMLKNDLNATSKVYLEFSNELWNTGGTQRWQRVLEDALADNDPQNPNRVNDGIDPNNHQRLISRQAAKILNDYSIILRSEIGHGRVKPILAGQTPNHGYLQYGLEYLAALDGIAPGQPYDLSSKIEGIAIAPYVGNDIARDEPIKLDPSGFPVLRPNGQPAYIDANTNNQMDEGEQLFGPDPDGRPLSLDDTPESREQYLNWLFPNLQTYIDTTLREGVQRHKQLADKYNVKLHSYEAGQHLVAFNTYFGADINAEHKVAANKDPRMAIIYHELLEMWKQESGGGIFNQFALVSPYGSFGSWGLLEDLTQTSSAKWDYFLNILGGDANLDGKVTFADFQILEENFGAHHTMWGDGDFNLDGQVDYNDFLIFRSKFDPQSLPPVEAAIVEAFAATAPEPGALTLAAAALALLGRRRTR